ncbi:hypothetical protein B0A66_21570 [Flavobacterium hercynium]|uniref:DNA-binding protein n=2 Tax=Flavobacterium hercynium TaxID=387094 RepID=A0A226GPS9_9FLAO|nr:hypothetical protein B0A66_21570 [Flavobacterium hercynium]
MNFIKQMERINTIHQLISAERTGSPTTFAKKIGLSRSQLYNMLDFIKELDAPVRYCKKRESFYYESSYELILNYSLKTITCDELKEIYGGFHLRPILLDGAMVNLQ